MTDMTTEHTPEHIPEIERIPEVLRSLDWVEMPRDMPIGVEGENYWEDGTQLLVAVPVRSRGQNRWYYEFSFIHLICDEDHFEIECEDVPWGWILEDIDYYVKIH